MSFSSFHRHRKVFRKVSRGRGASKQNESRVSKPSVQNPKEMPIMKTFTVVTTIKHQATINRYSIIEFSTKHEPFILFWNLKSSHLPNLAKEIQGNLTGKGLAISSFYVISGFRPKLCFESHGEKLFVFLGKIAEIELQFW